MASVHLPADREYLLNYLAGIASDDSDDDFNGYITDESTEDFSPSSTSADHAEDASSSPLRYPTRARQLLRVPQVNIKVIII